jgi:heme exporter protein B
MSLFYAFIAIIRRDLLLAVRRRSEIANPLLFFILVITLFPLGIGAQPHLLQAIAPGFRTDFIKSLSCLYFGVS